MSDEPGDLFSPIDYPKAEGLLYESILGAFQNALHIPRGVLSSEFRKFLGEAIRREAPTLRKSTLRMLFEGDIPGAPKPVADILPAFTKPLNQMFCLLDFCEALLYRHIEEVTKTKMIELKRDMKRLRKTTGTVRLPGLLPAVEKAMKKGEVHAK